MEGMDQLIKVPVKNSDIKSVVASRPLYKGVQLK